MADGIQLKCDVSGERKFAHNVYCKDKWVRFLLDFTDNFMIVVYENNKFQYQKKTNFLTKFKLY